MITIPKCSGNLDPSKVLPDGKTVEQAGLRVLGGSEEHRV